MARGGMERIGITHIDVVPHATPDLHPIRCFVKDGRVGIINPIGVEHSITTGATIVGKGRAIYCYRVWSCRPPRVGFARVKVEPGETVIRGAIALVELVL